jgi:hypothetical protein
MLRGAKAYAVAAKEAQRAKAEHERLTQALRKDYEKLPLEVDIRRVLRRLAAC